MSPTTRAVRVRERLADRSTRELCDDYVQVVCAWRRMPWVEQALSHALFARDPLAWVEWQLDGGLFGRPLPHRFYDLI